MAVGLLVLSLRNATGETSTKGQNSALSTAQFPVYSLRSRPHGHVSEMLMRRA